MQQEENFLKANAEYEHRLKEHLYQFDNSSDMGKGNTKNIK